MIPGNLYYVWSDYDEYDRKVSSYLHFFDDDSESFIIHHSHPILFITRTFDRREGDVCIFLYKNYYGFIYPEFCQFYEEINVLQQ